MPDKVVGMCFVTEFTMPSVGPICCRSVTAQKVKRRRCNAGLHAACRDAAEPIESVGMKNADRVLRISSVAFFTYPGAATSFHRGRFATQAGGVNRPIQFRAR